MSASTMAQALGSMINDVANGREVSLCDAINLALGTVGLAGSGLGLKNSLGKGFKQFSDWYNHSRLGQAWQSAKNQVGNWWNSNSTVLGDSSWVKTSGLLRDLRTRTGNFGIGVGTISDAETLGYAWVGDNYRVASNGAWISADGLRQYRPPSWKPRLGIIQANYEWRPVELPRWQSNGHLTITYGP